ncbi:MAG: hypothetical protein EPO01_18205 [Aquabacterium sp.]|nr:MAG: hypothetical protein EPO01_18205 [Aquabacterium sp.]
MTQATSRSTKRLLAAGVAALGLLAAGSAMADNVYWSVGVSAPIDGGRVRTHVGNVPPAAPVVVAPAPVVYAPPPPPAYGYPVAYPTAYYGAPRVVYAPPPVVYGRGFGWHHRHDDWRRWQGHHGHGGWRGEAYRHGYRDGYREDRRDGHRH